MCADPSPSPQAVWGPCACKGGFTTHHLSQSSFSLITKWQHLLKGWKQSGKGEIIFFTKTTQIPAAARKTQLPSYCRLRSHSLKCNQTNCYCCGACLKTSLLIQAFHACCSHQHALVFPKSRARARTFIVVSALECAIKRHRQHQPGAQSRHPARFLQRSIDAKMIQGPKLRCCGS